MYSVFPSSRFAIVTPSANLLTFAGSNVTTKAIKAAGAGNVTCENEIGTSIVVPFAENQLLPLVTSKITAYSGSGSLIALYQ